MRFGGGVGGVGGALQVGIVAAAPIPVELSWRTLTASTLSVCGLFAFWCLDEVALRLREVSAPLRHRLLAAYLGLCFLAIGNSSLRDAWVKW